MTLRRLANDPGLVPAGRAPYFPSWLVLLEQAYLTADDTGDEPQTEAALARFREALEEALTQDEQQLGEPDADREFLRLRMRVVRARMDSVGMAPVTPAATLPAEIVSTNGHGSAAHVELPVSMNGHSTAPMAAPEPLEPELVTPRPLEPEAQPPEPAAPPRLADLATRAQPSRQPEAVGGELRHRDDIQGLRAVAVLLVALGHAGLSVLQGGFVGVDVFFVLSGFLITGLLLAEATRRRFVSLVEFYLRRARRILPAATLTLIVGDLAAYHLLNFVRAKQYLLDSIPSGFFAANIHFAAQGTDYFAHGQPPSPFQHFWSLAVEEQFYIVWPALFALVLGLSLRRFGRRPRRLTERAQTRVLIVVGAISLVSLIWSIHYTLASQTAAYFSTPARAWELGLGAALAIAAPRIPALAARWRIAAGWLGVAMILAAAVTYSGSTPFPGYAALLPTLGAALVISAGLQPGLARHSVGRLLSLRPMRYIGDRSYSFYLWHWPVLVIAAQYAGHDLSLATNLLLLCGAFALSVLSYRFFENPIRHAEFGRRPESALAWAAAMISVFVLASIYVGTIDSREARQNLEAQNAATPLLALAPTSTAATVTPQPGATQSPQSTSSAASYAGAVIPAVIAEVNAEAHGRKLPAVLVPPPGQVLNDVARVPPDCIAHDGQTAQTVCNLGIPSSPRTLVVLGDSHAEMWMPAILNLAQRDGWSVRPILKSGCSPPMWNGTLGPSDCHTWFHWALTQDRQLRPEVTIVAGQYSHLGTGPDQASLNGLDFTAKALRGGSRVIMLADVPQRQQQPVDCLLARNATASGCSDGLTASEASLTSSVAQLASSDHVGFIDPTGWFCYESQCPLIVGNLITYRDNNHVSQTYAAALGAVFRAAFEAAIRSR